MRKIVRAAKIVARNTKEKQLNDKVKKDTLETLLKLLLEDIAPKPIDLVRSWVRQYDSDSPLDKLIAIIVQEAIGRIGKAVQRDCKKTGEMSGRKAVEHAVKQLRIMIEGYEKQLEKGEKFDHFDDEEDE